MIRKIFIAIFVLVMMSELVGVMSQRSRRNTESCGVPVNQMGLIVRGQSFPRGAFPWIVALMLTKTGSPQFFCAGTLVSRTFIVSAANCIHPKHATESVLARDILALFGAHDLSDPLEVGRIALSPKKVTIHDDWNQLGTKYDADLSLLEFEEGNIEYSAYIQPICLWNSEAEPTVTEGTITGWGRSEDSTKIHENVPKKAVVPIEPNIDCFLSERRLAELSSKRTFCAGLKNGTGVCSGDSGGGLFIEIDGVFHLKGIVSASLAKDGGCDVSKNAVYTNVLKFSDWLREKIPSQVPLVAQVTSTCGVPINQMGLIVLGQSFPRGAFPWIVALMHTGWSPPKFFCAGTLISKTFVVSAAHCILNKQANKQILPRDILALFGSHDLSNSYEAGRIVQSPEKILIHDDWNSSTVNFDANLALLEFEAGTIEYSMYIQPICLWNSEKKPTVTAGVVTGWGRSEETSKKHENLPKLIPALIESNEDCFLEDPKLIPLSSRRTFCAGLRNGSGVCHGDSGGGLFIKVDGVFHLMGIVSTSLLTHEYECDVSKNAIYTNVLDFEGWIKEKSGLASTSSIQSTSSATTTDSVCGKLKRTTPLIYRGQSFARGTFPWLVALKYTEKSPAQVICGATLISATHVISAAHCINGKGSTKILQPKHISVIFGAHELNSTDEVGRYWRSPSAITIHEDWDIHSGQYDADLALLTFRKGKIVFNEYVKPICLWTSKIEPAVTEGIVSGWGESERARRENSPKMIKAKIQSNTECLPGAGEIADISSDRTFCAGLKNGSGVCRGDSGGGLFILVDDLYYLKGIVSSAVLTAQLQCDTSKNSVFTNVFKFTDWIVEKTGQI